MKWSTLVTLITAVIACLSCMFICGIPVLTKLPAADEKPAFIATPGPLTLDGSILIEDPTVSGPPYYVFSNSVGTRLDEVVIPRA